MLSPREVFEVWGSWGWRILFRWICGSCILLPLKQAWGSVFYNHYFVKHLSGEKIVLITRIYFPKTKRSNESQNWFKFYFMTFQRLAPWDNLSEVKNGNNAKIIDRHITPRCNIRPIKTNVWCNIENKHMVFKNIVF